MCGNSLYLTCLYVLLFPVRTYLTGLQSLEVSAADLERVLLQMAPKIIFSRNTVSDSMLCKENDLSFLFVCFWGVFFSHF